MYYILRCMAPDDDTNGYMDIEDWVGISGFKDWGWGTLAKDRPTMPVVINAVAHDGYRGFPRELSDGTVPLMSERLKLALDGAGVDNIFYHPVTLRNPETGMTYDYFAFNIVGLISATDFSKSTVESYNGDFVGDSSIKNLTLDETTTYSIPIFRLAEKFSAILVHERVRKHMEQAGIDTLTFVKPEDYFHL